MWESLTPTGALFLIPPGNLLHLLQAAASLAYRGWVGGLSLSARGGNVYPGSGCCSVTPVRLQFQVLLQRFHPAGVQELSRPPALPGVPLRAFIG